MAGDHRRERLLPAELDPLRVAGEHVAVRLAYWPNYHYYHGHVMWDIETFTVPPLLLLAPDAAHALLDYRHPAPRPRPTTMPRCMVGAAPCIRGRAVRSTARRRRPALGHTPRTTSALDVALAFARYVHATGDLDYARRIAWPVLRSVAEFVASRVVRTKRGYEIADTVGPREVYESVDNNAYTNMSAAMALRGGRDCARPIGERARHGSGSEIANGLVLPRDTRRGTIMNHDGASLDEPQGGVPEGAAGLFPVGYRRRRLEAGHLSIRRRRAGAAVCRRAHAERACCRSSRPARASRRSRASSSSRDTESSSTSRSWSRTSTLGREQTAPERLRCSPI